jgi:hypothetical protein
MAPEFRGETMNSLYHEAISEQALVRRAPCVNGRPRLAVVGLVLMVGMLILASCTTRAHPPRTVRLPAPVLVSGPDPLPDVTDSNHCGSAAGTDFDRHGYESQAAVAVNPTNPANLVAAWIQDNFNAIVVGFSFEGGRTWTEVVPPTTKCTPGGSPLYGIALDPWLSFGPDGVVYLSLAVAGSGFQDTAEIVDTSLDGGRTWSKSVVDTLSLSADGLVIDGSNVLADPAHPGSAYVQWSQQDLQFKMRANYVSHTMDGGHTWSPPLPVPHKAGLFPGTGRLLLLGDGTLLDVSPEIPTPGPCDPTGQDKSLPACPTGNWPPGPTTLAATRLMEGTWTVPVTIAVEEWKDVGVGPGVALAPNGTIHVSWQHFVKNSNLGVPPSLTLMDYQSADGGLHWKGGTVGDPVKSRSERDGLALAAPSVAVSGDGIVGVAFYDHRNDPDRNLISGRKVGDVWFRFSHDGGNTWVEGHVAGPFDHTAAPDLGGSPISGGGGFIGNYQGIAPLPGGGFVITYTLATPLSGANFALGLCPTTETTPCIPTDIFSTVVSVAAISRSP